MNFSKQDSKYIEDQIKAGTSLDQAIAQMEALRDDSLFKQNLVNALTDSKVLIKLQQVIHDCTRKEPYD
jgi:hypothetical protein